MVADRGRNDREAVRPDELWSGAFGDHYSERNADAGTHRRAFWDGLLSKYPVRRVLEVGCNGGANLQWIAPRVAPGGSFGIDVNLGALERLRRRVPQVNAVAATAREIPFPDESFDFVFTTGVLIHQPDATLPVVMKEVVRVSRRFVLCGEYFALKRIEVPYRGIDGVLFKRDYGRIYGELFPELELLDQGALGRSEGWDDLTWWLFEKPYLGSLRP